MKFYSILEKFFISSIRFKNMSNTNIINIILFFILDLPFLQIVISIKENNLVSTSFLLMKNILKCIKKGNGNGNGNVMNSQEQRQ